MLKTLGGKLELTGRLRAEEKLINTKEAKCKQKQNVSYLDNHTQASISTDRKICARDIVTNSGRQNAYRDAKLLMAVSTISHHDRSLESLKQQGHDS